MELDINLNLMRGLVEMGFGVFHSYKFQRYMEKNSGMFSFLEDIVEYKRALGQEFPDRDLGSQFEGVKRHDQRSAWLRELGIASILGMINYSQDHNPVSCFMSYVHVGLGSYLARKFTGFFPGKKYDGIREKTQTLLDEMKEVLMVNGDSDAIVERYTEFTKSIIDACKDDKEKEILDAFFEESFMFHLYYGNRYYWVREMVDFESPEERKYGLNTQISGSLIGDEAYVVLIDENEGIGYDVEFERVKERGTIEGFFDTVFSVTKANEIVFGHDLDSLVKFILRNQNDRPLMLVSGAQEHDRQIRLNAAFLELLSSRKEQIKEKFQKEN